jgi:hypothetical protein
VSWSFPPVRIPVYMRVLYMGISSIDVLDREVRRRRWGVDRSIEGLGPVVVGGGARLLQLFNSIEAVVLLRQLRKLSVIA